MSPRNGAALFTSWAALGCDAVASLWLWAVGCGPALPASTRLPFERTPVVLLVCYMPLANLRCSERLLSYYSPETVRTGAAQLTELLHRIIKAFEDVLARDNHACLQSAATLLCCQRICGPAVEAEPHKDLQRGPPQQRQRGLPRLCKYTENIKLPSTPTPSVRAGRRRPVLRGRPRQRHRLQEGRVGPRDAGRTTRAEGKI